MVRVRYSFSSRRTGNIDNIAKHREKFPRLVQGMIRVCDIILEVLDARFIDETRNIHLENVIKYNHKSLIYVVNKSDLVDINEKKKELKAKNLYPYVLISCTKRMGSRKLRDRIKIEVKKLESKYERIQVGVIGYPNAGKSSLINLITGKSSARTAPEAGFTKGIQRIKLAENILLLDTPGVIPEEDYSSNSIDAFAKHARIGVRTHDKVKNPEYVISRLMETHAKEIEAHYGTNSEGNAEAFIEELGRKKKLLKKGNLVDVDRTARMVLKDWQLGKIRV